MFLLILIFCADLVAGADSRRCDRIPSRRQSTVRPVDVVTLFRANQTGRWVLGEDIDNCTGSADDPIDRARTAVNSTTARMTTCHRNAIRVRTVTDIE